MEMELDIHINSFSVEIKPVVDKGNIRAIVNWKFQTSIGMLKICYGTIREKQFSTNSKPILVYEPPKIGEGYFTALFLENEAFYKQFCTFSVKAYLQQVNGGENNHSDGEEEEVNPDDLPF